MKLYTYFRSSAAWRVRIALSLKGIEAEHIAISLLKGDQSSDDYLKANPMGLIPALETPEGVIAESLAIIEWLDETHPQPPLLPRDAFARAEVRAMAQMIACDIHPLNNLRVLNYLKKDLGQDEDAVKAWYAHWITRGFEGLEATARRHAGKGDFLYGNIPTLADICLVPQIYNARRFKVDLVAFPRLLNVDEACRALPAFAGTAPENQPDAA
jgi:maleylpyruvate isomerase